jgi:hypothetical protein
MSGENKGKNVEIFQNYFSQVCRVNIIIIVIIEYRHFILLIATVNEIKILTSPTYF